MGDKKHKPSEKKLIKARHDGANRKSAIFTNACTVFGIFTVILIYSRFAWVDCEMLLEFMHVGHELELIVALKRALSSALSIFLPVLFFGSIFGMAINVAQSGFFVDPVLLLPKLGRISPEKGIKKISSSFSMLPAVVLRLITFLIYAGIIFYLYYTVFLEEIVYDNQTSRSIFLLPKILLFLSASLIFLGAIDLFFTRRKFKEQHFLDDQQLKEEHKSEEGDPHYKFKRRAMHEAISRQEIINRVRRSKVIILGSSNGGKR